MGVDANTRAVGEILELDVGPVAHGGSCVARHEGQVVFVRHALPGERVRAAVTEERSRFLRADAVEVIDASPDRVRQPCPYAGPGLCGGCDWQHATLDAQRRLKAEVVEEQLRRLAGIERSVTVEPVSSDETGLGWRTRTRFAIGEDGVVGLHRHRSREVQPIDACIITHRAVEEIGVERRSWPGMSSVEAIAGVETGDRALVVTPARQEAPVEVPPLDVPASILRHPGRGAVQRVRGHTGVREVAAGRRWRVSGGGFWQVHAGAADLLADAVVEALQPRVGESVLDLYCGVGLFAGVLAEQVGAGGRVIAVESDRAAATDAQRNLRDLPQALVERGRATDVLDGLGLVRSDLVVLDPPRTGAGRAVVERLCEIQTRRIAYVACDPAALARDLAYFAEGGWRLEHLRAFDLFPMTAHVECLATLERTVATAKRGRSLSI